MTSYGKQSISKEDISAVVEVLNSDYLTQGPVVDKFEKVISKITKSSYATAVNSATSALHLGCIALGVKKNDLVWTSANSFVASSNCALYCGAEVDFIDIDPETDNISIGFLEEKLKLAKKNNKLPKLIIPVHLSGSSCEMFELHSLSKKYGFKILEDASHCIGGSYKGKPIGSCEYSDACVFSFHPVKIITTGEGGVITTNSKEIDDQIKALRSHGVVRDSSKFKNKMSPPFYYEMQFLGFNYRMTEIQAALGISQSKKLPQIIKKRWELASIYDQEIKNGIIEKPNLDLRKGSAFHLYIVKIKEKRDSLLNQLKNNGIYTTVHYLPIHLQPYYLNLGFATGDFPNSEAYGKNAISLPLHQTLTDKEQSKVIGILNNL